MISPSTSETQELEGSIYLAWDEYYSQLEKVFNRVRGRGVSPENNRYFTVFRMIANKCIATGVPVRDFVASAFTLLLKSRRNILPKDLMHPDVMTRYRQLVARQGGGLAAVQWISQVKNLKLLCESAPADYPEAQTALMMIALPFTAWFRVLYLRPFNETLFELYGAIAWDELRRDPNLRSIVRKKAPENMRELEQRIAYFGDPIGG